MFVVTVLFLLLGAFLDTLLMLLIIVPMLMPTVLALGIDPVHFGVVSVVNMMIGLVTPPIGELVFLMAGVTGIQVADITRELWPFLLVLVALLFVLVYVPAITLWLPETMGYVVQGRLHALKRSRRMPGMKDLVKGTDRYRHFIGGEWVDSTLKEWIEVENPATGETIASVPKGSAEDADRAVQAAWNGAARLGGAAAAVARPAAARRWRGSSSRTASGWRRWWWPSRASPSTRRAARSRARRSISSTPPRRRGGSPATSSPPTIPTSRSGSRRWRTASWWR